MPELGSNITFAVFTYNKEKRIDRAIWNFLPFSPVLVVDNESVDRTREIALHHCCEALLNKNSSWAEDETTAAYVKAAVGTPWIYWRFAGDMVVAKTIRAILSEVDSGRRDIANVVRNNYYYGEFCHERFADR